MKKLSLAGTVAIMVLACFAPAAAHSRFISSIPKKDAQLAAPPKTIELNYSEPPTGDAVVTVRDGCGDDVVTEVAVSNTKVSAPLSTGQAGVWRVRYGVVSAVDGHPTRGAFTFTVDGPQDCSKGGGPPRKEEGDSGFVLLLIGGGLLLLFGMLGIAYLSSRRNSGWQRGHQ